MEGEHFTKVLKCITFDAHRYHQVYTILLHFLKVEVTTHKIIA
jgi:hypothetical protein